MSKSTPGREEKGSSLGFLGPLVSEQPCPLWPWQSRKNHNPIWGSAQAPGYVSFLKPWLSDLGQWFLQAASTVRGSLVGCEVLGLLSFQPSLARGQSWRLLSRCLFPRGCYYLCLPASEEENGGWGWGTRTLASHWESLSVEHSR